MSPLVTVTLTDDATKGSVRGLRRRRHELRRATPAARRIAIRAHRTLIVREVQPSAWSDALRRFVVQRSRRPLCRCHDWGRANGSAHVELCAGGRRRSLVPRRFADDFQCFRSAQGQGTRSSSRLRRQAACAHLRQESPGGHVARCRAQSARKRRLLRISQEGGSAPSRSDAECAHVRRDEAHRCGEAKLFGVERRQGSERPRVGHASDDHRRIPRRAPSRERARARRSGDRRGVSTNIELLIGDTVDIQAGSTFKLDNPPGTLGL